MVFAVWKTPRGSVSVHSQRSHGKAAFSHHFCVWCSRPYQTQSADCDHCEACRFAPSWEKLPLASLQSLNLKFGCHKIEVWSCVLQTSVNNSWICAFQMTSLTDSGSELKEFISCWIFHPGCNNKAFWIGCSRYSFWLDSKHKEMKQGHNITARLKITTQGSHVWKMIKIISILEHKSLNALRFYYH